MKRGKARDRRGEREGEERLPRHSAHAREPQPRKQAGEDHRKQAVHRQRSNETLDDREPRAKQELDRHQRTNKGTKGEARRTRASVDPAKKPGKDRGEREPAEQIGCGGGRRGVLPCCNAEDREESGEADCNK